MTFVFALISLKISPCVLQSAFRICCHTSSIAWLGAVYTCFSLASRDLPLTLDLLHHPSRCIRLFVPSWQQSGVLTACQPAGLPATAQTLSDHTEGTFLSGISQHTCCLRGGAEAAKTDLPVKCGLACVEHQSQRVFRAILFTTVLVVFAGRITCVKTPPRHCSYDMGKAILRFAICQWNDPEMCSDAATFR